MNRKYTETLLNDPMSRYAPVDEILEAFGDKHRLACERCNDFGNANVDFGP